MNPVSYFFNQVFKSTLSKLLFFVFISGVIFVGFYNIRFNLFNFVTTIIKGVQYNNIATWKQDTPYGFTEDEKKAVDLFEDGLENLAEKAHDIYKIDEPDKIILGLAKTNLSWQNYLDLNSLELVLSLLYEIHTFCGDVKSIEDFHSEWKNEENENINSLKNNYQKERIRIDSKKMAQKYRLWILDNDFKYFHHALQKKPDLWGALTIRTSILDATCLPVKTTQIWNDAVNYIEYKTEKFVFENLIQRRKEARISDAFLLVEDALRQDVYYHKILKVFFERTLPLAPIPEWKMRSLAKAFDRTKDIDILNNYIKAALEQCQIDSVESCTAIYNNLFSLESADILNNSNYIYTLAEVAYRAKLYEKSLQHINRAIEQEIFKDPSDHKKAERLLLMLHLSQGISLLDVPNHLRKNTQR